MKRNAFFRGLSLLLAVLLLVGIAPSLKLTASAVVLNTAITADPAAWGTQDNNGWYYLYKLANGTYHEMNFYDGTDETEWRQNAFASDLSTTPEMFFINQGAVFCGENDTRPVFAYEAPESGEVTLRMQTHSTSPMHMQVYVNNTLQQIGGADSLTLTNTGALPGAMTLTELLLTVTKGQRIYVEFYSTDKDAQRQAWINEYSVTYTQITETPPDPADIIGEPFTADSADWGTQNNNGWYYLYKLANGTYHEMNFYDSTDGVNWRQNAFASDLSTTVEMFFINQTSLFYGENDTRPVLAFQAPESGEVTLRMQTHSTSAMHMQVYVNNTLQQIGGEDSLTLTNTGTLPGDMTLTELTMSVKKGQRIYVEFYSTDKPSQRQAWINEYSVTYNSVQPGDEPDLTGHTFAPNLAAWGTQGNNGWYYMYQSGSTGQYGFLDYYDETASIDWQQNNYAFDPYTMGEMLFVDQVHFYTGELGSKPVYAFRAPATGRIQVDFETLGQSAMGLSAFVESRLVQIGGSDRYAFTTTGTLAGGFTAGSFETVIEKGQMLYLVCSSTDSAVRDGWLRNQSVTYLEMLDEDDFLRIKSASLRLDEDIDVIYTVSVPDGYSNPYMVINGTTISTSVVSGSDRQFIYTGLTPQRMTDNISATLYATKDGVTESVSIANYSIKQYCSNLLNQTENESLVTLLSDLLTYGTAAQIYTNYNTGNFATSGLTLSPSTFPGLSGKSVTFTGAADSGTYWSEATLVLGNTVGIRLYFYTDAQISIDVTINGSTESYDSGFVSCGNGRYYLDIPGIEATDFDAAVTAEFYDNGVKIGNTLGYSVNTYICGMQNASNAPLQALVRALYNYGASAAAYTEQPESRFKIEAADPDGSGWLPLIP